MSKVPATHKLSAIEGLRGYLAVAVMLTHIVVFSALIKDPAAFFHTHLFGVIDLLLEGPMFVSCFMIISGFVIFMAIDRKKETYGVYILRRAMRIYPLYLVCFLVSIPCLHLAQLTLDYYGPFMAPNDIDAIRQEYASDWSNIWIHVPLHLLLAHGLVSELILPHSSTAFLGQAWSLSVEWQFYLIAPLWYALFIVPRGWKRDSMYLVCFVFAIYGRRLYEIGLGAMLPTQLLYFLTGILSYQVYKALRDYPFRDDVVLPLMLILEVAIFRWVGHPIVLLPLLGWSFVLGLLFEPPQSLSSRLIAPIFTNPVMLWLGKVSYGVYLVHGIVLSVVQYLILSSTPTITQAHLLALLMVTVPALTFAVSGLLYRFLEHPCIELGKRWTGEPLKVTFSLRDNKRDKASASSQK